MVREQTFRPRPDLYMLFAAIDDAAGVIEHVWLVPSEVFDARAMRLTVRGRPTLRFVASAKDGSKDQWREYRLAPDQWPRRVLEVIDGLEGG